MYNKKPGPGALQNTGWPRERQCTCSCFDKWTIRSPAQELYRTQHDDFRMNKTVSLSLVYAFRMNTKQVFELVKSNSDLLDNFGIMILMFYSHSLIQMTTTFPIKTNK